MYGSIHTYLWSRPLNYKAVQYMIASLTVLCFFFGVAYIDHTMAEL